MATRPTPSKTSSSRKAFGKAAAKKSARPAVPDETIYSRDEDMQECIDNCTDCAQVCEQLITHCLSKGGHHSAPEHIRLLIDCAEACKTSVGFMIRNSPFHPMTCGTCAQICTSCADDCETMNDDELMQECIEICRRCATSCAAMAQMQ